MHILMVTNTYAPHVGGVARSVERFSREYIKAGHQVTVIAPGKGADSDDDWDGPRVVRIPAISDSTGFSLPVLSKSRESDLSLAIALHAPDIIHSHHPFLLGDFARRLSDRLKTPLVFTHHTMYEQYSYVLRASVNSQLTPGFLKALATEYANQTDLTIAPSASTRSIIEGRGVRARVVVVPTGVDTAKFSRGEGALFRQRLGIPLDAPVIGHVGRLAPEKNLGFLYKAVARALRRRPEAHFLLVGDGPAKREAPLEFQGRWHTTGSLQGQDLVDAYHALDVFAFSSKSETQGMVLVEAMATGAPVVALDAPGARDVLETYNGRLVRTQPATPNAFAGELLKVLQRVKRLRPGALKTAQRYSQEACARRALRAYEQAVYVPKPARYLSAFMLR